MIRDRAISPIPAGEGDLDGRSMRWIEYELAFVALADAGFVAYAR